ncbi:hypothetical protein [Pararhizobium sp. A13]|uniref:hypothetical protein n=1 Tax=Pararhizobium sp. A13 TaxID=3133975 RepID=UPI00324901D1
MKGHFDRNGEMPFLFSGYQSGSAGTVHFGMVCFRHLRRRNACRKLQTAHHNAHWWHSLLPAGERWKYDIFVVQSENSGYFLGFLPIFAPANLMSQTFISLQSLASMPMSLLERPDDAFPRDKCDIRGAWDPLNEQAIDQKTFSRLFPGTELFHAAVFRGNRNTPYRQSHAGL